MKQTALLSMISAGVTLLFAAFAAPVYAQSYTIATSNGVVNDSLNIGGGQFTFVDYADSIFGYENGVGTLDVAGNYNAIAGSLTGVIATWTSNAPDSSSQTLISNGTGQYATFADVNLPNIGIVALSDGKGDNLSYTTTSITATSNPNMFTFISGGGSYTPAAVAPEGDTLYGLGAMLLAGGVILFAKKRLSAGAS